MSTLEERNKVSKAGKSEEQVSSYRTICHNCQAEASVVQTKKGVHLPHIFEQGDVWGLPTGYVVTFIEVSFKCPNSCDPPTPGEDFIL